MYAVIAILSFKRPAPSIKRDIIAYPDEES